MATEGSNGDTVSLLIVEDNPDHLELVQAALDKHHNWKIDTADSLARAYDLIIHNYFDVVLVDYVLPDGRGIDLLDWVNKECAVVVMTSQGSEEIVVESFRRGAINYVVKDTLFGHNLLEAVEQAVNKESVKMR